MFSSGTFWGIIPLPFLGIGYHYISHSNIIFSPKVDIFVSLQFPQKFHSTAFTDGILGIINDFWLNIFFSLMYFTLFYWIYITDECLIDLSSCINFPSSYFCIYGILWILFPLSNTLRDKASMSLVVLYRFFQYMNICQISILLLVWGMKTLLKNKWI